MKWLESGLITVIALSLLGFGLFRMSWAASTSHFNQTIIPLPECNDTIDNDGDSLIDYPEDTGCDSLIDDTENDVHGVSSGSGSTGDSESTPTPLLSNGSLMVSGRAYVNRTVYLLQNGQEVAHAQASASGVFAISVNSLASGSYNFSLYALDARGRRGNIAGSSITILPGQVSSLSGIVFPPTIGLSTPSFRLGDRIKAEGQAYPNTKVAIIARPSGVRTSELRALDTVDTDREGSYSYQFDTRGFDKQDYDLWVDLVDAALGRASSDLARLTLDSSKKNLDLKTKEKVDFNEDDRVDIKDLSRLVYWYGRKDPPAYMDLNDDGEVNLIDISIFVHYWTG